MLKEVTTLYVLWHVEKFGHSSSCKSQNENLIMTCSTGQELRMYTTVFYCLKSFCRSEIASAGDSSKIDECHQNIHTNQHLRHYWQHHRYIVYRENNRVFVIEPHETSLMVIISDGEKKKTHKKYTLRFTISVIPELYHTDMPDNPVLYRFYYPGLY